MRRERRSRIRETRGRILDLPPPFRAVVLREAGDAFVYACAQAAELGAGTLVFVGRFGLAEFAIVLEPDEPLASARRVFYACMVALADALAALAPPEKPIVIEWPDAVYIDRGLVGGGRLGWPGEADERAPPDWLVFGAAIRTISPSRAAIGPPRLTTALDEEGFGDVSSERLAEGFARHLMVALDRWQHGGFTPIAQEYISKLKPESGVRREIDENGDLGMRCAGRRLECGRLLPALKAPTWLGRV